MQRKVFNWKPVLFHVLAHQGTPQAVCQCNYASDARTQRELCQLAGLPKRWLLKLHSQERYNENLWYGQGFFSWSQLGTTAPPGEDIQNVPGTVLLLPSIAEAEWTVWPSSSIFYQLFTLRHLCSFLHHSTLQPPALQHHSCCIRVAEHTQAWLIKSNPNQS